MKPYGREKNIKGSGPWKEDCHPPKGWHNWWEGMAECFSRTTMKYRIKKQIEDEISE